MGAEVKRGDGFVPGRDTAKAEPGGLEGELVGGVEQPLFFGEATSLLDEHASDDTGNINRDMRAGSKRDLPV